MSALPAAPASRPGTICAIHATAVVVGDAGVLIRGRSGSGKSSLALTLVRNARSAGCFARLVGDDRVRLAAVNGRLVVEPHPVIAGRIERRGVGIVETAHEPRAIVRLVVDLRTDDDACGVPPRMPGPDDRFVEIAATRIPRLVLPADAGPEVCAAHVLSSLLE